MSEHSAESADPIRPERTLDPEYVEWGTWYVDDQVQVVFFDTETEAQQYADYCIAADLDRASSPATTYAECGDCEATDAMTGDPECQSCDGSGLVPYSPGSPTPDAAA